MAAASRVRRAINLPAGTDDRPASLEAAGPGAGTRATTLVEVFADALPLYTLNR